MLPRKNTIVKAFTKVLREPGDGWYRGSFVTHWNGERFITSEVEPGIHRVDGSPEIFEVYDTYLRGLYFKAREDPKAWRLANRPFKPTGDAK